MKIAAIGCSFTNYVWPSYSDVLQADNYGLSGIGNDRIWYILLHLYKTKQLEMYDAIIIQWTSPYRFDYRTNKGWTHNDGNIATSQHNAYIWNNIKNWYNESYEQERTENYIYAIKSILKDINIKAYHMSMTDDIDSLVDLPNLRKLYTARYNFRTAPWSNKPFIDDHPTVLDHIEIAKKIANNLQIDLNQKIIKRCIEFHHTVEQTDDFGKIYKLYKSNFPDGYITTGL